MSVSAAAQPAGADAGIVARRRLAYILAPSHSGSTLLAMLLGSHPDVCTIGELSLSAMDSPTAYLCSCGQHLGRCAFWMDIAERMRARGFTFDVAAAGTDYRAVPSRVARRLLRPLHRGPLLEWARDSALALSPAWRETYATAQTRNQALVDCVCAATGSQVIVDSSKVGVRLKFLLRNQHLDVRVIRLVRDGRAVALTYMDPAEFADSRERRLRGGGTGGSREGERLPMADAAEEWRRSHEEANAIVAGLPPTQWLQIRYEELCTRTEDTLARVFRFLDVDPARPRPRFRAVAQHVVGNGMRLDQTNEVILDARWKSVLSPRDRAAFDEVAGDLNRHFGYDG